MTHSE